MQAACTTGRSERTEADLFERYIPVVRRMARRLVRRLPAHVELDDLVSAGLVGLTEAVHRYRAGRSEGFAAYVQKRVSGAMRDELRTLDPLTRDQRRQVRAVQTTERGLAQTLGRAAGSDEVAVALGMDLERLHQVRETQLAAQPRARDVRLDDEELEDPLARAADPDWTAQDDACEHRELASRVANAIDALPERLRTVLGLYYQDGLLLREIGHVMGFSEARACQLHRDAVSRLRTAAQAA